MVCVAALPAPVGLGTLMRTHRGSSPEWRNRRTRLNRAIVSCPMAVPEDSVR